MVRTTNNTTYDMNFEKILDAHRPLRRTRNHPKALKVVEMLPDPRAARSFLLSSFFRTLDGYHLVKLKGVPAQHERLYRGDTRLEAKLKAKAERFVKTVKEYNPVKLLDCTVKIIHIRARFEANRK